MTSNHLCIPSEESLEDGFGDGAEGVLERLRGRERGVLFVVQIVDEDYDAVD